MVFQRIIIIVFGQIEDAEEAENDHDSLGDEGTEFQDLEIGDKLLLFIYCWLYR